MIHARLDTWHRYLGGEVWTTVFTFLSELPAHSAPKNDIAVHPCGAFAHVMRYSTRDPEQALLEAHDRFIDVQMSLDGAERIDIFERSPLQVKTPYDPQRDAVFFERPGPAHIRVDNVPGMFSVLFPEDAHMAQLDPRTGRNEVTKVVVKVPLAAVEGKQTQ